MNRINGYEIHISPNQTTKIRKKPEEINLKDYEQPFFKYEEEDEDL